MLSRRQMLALTSAGVVMPRSLLADGLEGGERKFMFIFATGGWDPAYVFAPMFDSSVVEMEGDVAFGQVGNIPFVDSPTRRAVRSFFERYGDQTCIINGIESRSVAHDVCLRLILTGSTLPNADDWPAMLAARSWRRQPSPSREGSGSGRRE
jgi:hypothetical protein